MKLNKGIIQLKIKILSTFPHPHVVSKHVAYVFIFTEHIQEEFHMPHLGFGLVIKEGGITAINSKFCMAFPN